MKKLLIGAIVGGIILFLWQFLSWGISQMHGSMQAYTPKQDSVLQYLNSQFSEDGFYFMPNYAPGTSREEMEKQMKEKDGKPWVQVYYHKALHVSMGGNMARGLIVDILAVGLLCWLLLKINAPGFGTILGGAMGVGLISYLYFPYTYHIWFQTADAMAYLADALVPWALCGLWLGWWLRKR